MMFMHASCHGCWRFPAGHLLAGNTPGIVLRVVGLHTHEWRCTAVRCHRAEWNGVGCISPLAMLPHWNVFFCIRSIVSVLAMHACQSLCLNDTRSACCSEGVSRHCMAVRALVCFMAVASTVHTPMPRLACTSAAVSFVGWAWMPWRCFCLPGARPAPALPSGALRSCGSCMNALAGLCAAQASAPRLRYSAGSSNARLCTSRLPCMACGACAWYCRQVA